MKHLHLENGNDNVVDKYTYRKEKEDKNILYKVYVSTWDLKLKMCMKISTELLIKLHRN